TGGGIAYYLNLCDFSKIIATVPADAPETFLRRAPGFGDARAQRLRSGPAPTRFEACPQL
ncbi:MAG: hypothetical protein KGJ83_09070, partial [Betaproteobacteria bacterium]|nr:hypothetical protein [Betaproteobacteria bacterium]